ncbi:ComEA family DNA-binding protein [Brachybacterium sp. FME24]|uniref:ComEA family DNA-binding protein n=1 Tax=Brachybacterium sp. FME24 TaxID=2742605 RepID=UPI0018682A44|nr:ComEA family DNA-binding protein [Brachybacterium sp. FME24]
MGAQGRSSGVGRRPAGRHRRTGDALIERRDHTEHKPARRFTLPSPSPSALVGIAVLVLIAVGVIHLSGAGTAVPLGGEDVVAAESATADEDPAAAEADIDTDAVTEKENGAEPDVDPDTAGSSTGSAGRDDSAPAEDGAENTSATDGPSELVVHVSGAVESPGVVKLPPGSRVDDALRAAGGATADGELSAVNLARTVTDGEQIHVPRPGEEPPAAVSAPSGAGEGEDGGGADSSDAGSSAGGHIDLNTATATDLEQLPGVGPAIAQRILEHREKNGPFTSVDGLLEVSGIGPATLEEIRGTATV